MVGHLLGHGFVFDDRKRLGVDEDDAEEENVRVPLLLLWLLFELDFCLPGGAFVLWLGPRPGALRHFEVDSAARPLLCCRQSYNLTLSLIIPYASAIFVNISFDAFFSFSDADGSVRSGWYWSANLL